jgi:Domain of unknown function (DUF4838)/Carbohydrate family 9 binding domain-like
MNPTRLSLLILVCLPLASISAKDWPKDLNPVTIKETPAHPPLTLVEKGQGRASIAVMGPQSAQLNQAVQNLQTFIQEATGAKLPVVVGKATAPAIVVGDCDLAKQAGLVGSQMPIEGFAIKTTAEFVFIVGRDEDLPNSKARSDGTAWGVCEFLERFVGVRCYFPGDLGRSIPKTDTLRIDPVWLTDAPVFRKREIWPPMSEPWTGKGTQLAPHHGFLRAGNSWPIQLVVHSPDWSKVKEYREDRPEVFQLRSDGTRDFSMLCYSHPKTLQTYLENIERSVAGKQPVHLGIEGKAVTVSPADAEIACYAPESRKLWDPKGGQYGSASRLVATFVANLAGEVKTRWPDRTIVYLPYLNYSQAADGVTFPGNVEVQLCGMPGLALYKEPEVARSEQDNIDKWIKASGRKIQGWHYDCWPEDRTPAVYLFPHTIRDFYRANRDKTVGTFINGTTDHWPRQHLSLYCWLKVLWNPEFDVDAAIDEYCRRMYGPAAATMRELATLQIDGWEKGRLPGGRLSAKGIHEFCFPRKTVLRMEALLEQARKQAGAEELSQKRIAYYAAPFALFFKESKSYAEGGGLTPLVIQRAGENPVIDGKLDDAVWARAQEVPFVRAYDKAKKEPRYATTVKAVWTADGVTFGFRLTEPTPDRIERALKGHDDSMLWWDDNIELLFDVTGKNEGEFYHFIINANNAVADARGKDFSWNAEGVKTATFLGKDFWSMEVFVPYKAFPEAARPGPGKVVTWHGNFTRHRVADRGLKPKFASFPDSEREYTRMNTTYAVPSNNLADFAPWKFVE